VIDIIPLHAKCQLGISEAQSWSDRLATDALSLEPGAAQRFAVLGTHALDKITALWESRLPSIPTDGISPPQREYADISEYVASLRAEVTALDAATNPDLDPSTHRMCQRLIFEIDLLADDARRIGVTL